MKTCMIYLLLVVTVSAAEQVTVGIVFDERIALHDNGASHPESPQRLTWITDGLQARGLQQELVSIPAQFATQDQILRVHPQAHIDIYANDVQNIIRKTSRDAIRLAAGSAIAACDAVMDGTVQRAFAVVRPPGHHASAETAEGFCYLNNIVIAAQHLRHTHQLERVLIIDWDVHAGNGTYALCKADPTIFDFHVHQDPMTIYPGTGFAHERGVGEGEGFSANHPLPPGTDGAGVLAIFNTELRAVCERFKPQFILISAGFDMHQADPLGQFRLTSEDFATLTAIVISLAEEHCQGRVVSVLEGGYSRAAMHDAVPLHIQALQQAAY